jgi:peroxiredoxin
MLILPFFAIAQQMTVNKFILPDGKQITPDKLDSVKKAWNGEPIAFQHNDEDDKAHVMHLIKMSPEMAKDFDEKANAARLAMQTMTGETAPDFILKDINGQIWKLSSLKGKVVVLNFWFISCPPCLQEMPKLNDLVKKYDGQEVIFLGLTYNDQSRVETFLKGHEFRYTLLPSSQQVDKTYQINSWPTSFVIGRDGKVKMAANFDEHVFSTLSGWIDRALIEKM